MPVTSVGIREAKANLSKYLKMVHGGAEILITDRGRPVGRLVPVKEKELSLTDRIKRLEDQGLLSKPPAGSRKKRPSPIAIPGVVDIAQKYLQEDRNHG
ncbi:MAG: type II toxin-antitoxin system prevent-host-death family antitoxin [Desulfobacterales bacterium]|nr:type II toxin-antitoxin system prevent-host-death family antitoxin [Desulfobacterales bacterium]